MTMTFSLNDNFEFGGTVNRLDLYPAAKNDVGETDKTDFHLFAEKLQIPAIENHFPRPRLIKSIGKISRSFWRNFDNRTRRNGENCSCRGLCQAIQKNKLAFH